MIQTIPISSIIFDVEATVGDVQLIPRTEYDQAAIRRYRKALIEGRPLPAVVVLQVGDTRILADGRHRLRAHLALGRSEIAAHLFKETSYEDAVQRAWVALCEGRHRRVSPGECPTSPRVEKQARRTGGGSPAVGPLRD